MSSALSSSLIQLIQQHLHADVQQLALQRNRFPQLSDADFRFLLQQIDGRQRTLHKLPTFAQMEDWWYPVRLSCEQCSSEATARYKAELLRQLGDEAIEGKITTLIDLTAGYGVDSFFMAEHTKEAYYVERNAELCAIAEHNFSLHRPHIQIHNTTAEDFLSDSQHAIHHSQHTTLIFLDPARRSQSGGKVFRIEDCEPNILTLLPTLRANADRIMIKFSPMLDITAALRCLGNDWDTHIVAVNNEVKEVLFFTGKGAMHAVNIRATHTDIFRFYDAEEKRASASIAPAIKQYIYEPNAAIIKAGAFRLISQRYALDKLDTNTHLYTSDTLLPDFPGRIWQVQEHASKCLNLNPKCKYSILSRNYPLSPEQLRKKLKLQDGNDLYIIAARHQGKPTLILAERYVCKGKV